MHILQNIWRKTLSYLFQLIPLNQNVYATASSQSNKITSFKTKHKFLKDTLFSAVVIKWNVLDINYMNLIFYSFKKELLKFTTAKPNLTLNVPCISESCIEIKIKLNFKFHTSLWRLKRYLN